MCDLSELKDPFAVTGMMDVRKWRRSFLRVFDMVLIPTSYLFIYRVVVWSSLGVIFYHYRIVCVPNIVWQMGEININQVFIGSRHVTYLWLRILFYELCSCTLNTDVIKIWIKARIMKIKTYYSCCFDKKTRDQTNNLLEQWKLATSTNKSTKCNNKQ